MKARLNVDRSYEFYLADCDTHLEVEESQEEVVIRATRNNIPERRKLHFLRELAMEGFVSEQYQWITSATLAGSGVRWVVDTAWLSLPQASTARNRKLILRMLAGSVLFWLSLMTALFLHKL